MYFKKLKKFLTSPKTTIALILIIIAFCILGISIPQITERSPSYFELWKEKNIYTYRIVNRLQLNRIYTSFWFLITIFLALVSLGYSIYLQVKRNIFRSSLCEGFEIIGSQGSQFTAHNLDVDKIRKIFKRKRFREHSTVCSKQKFVFTKNSIGRWGSVLLHLGIFLVIVSALLVLTFQKRGYVQIIKGDTFSGKHSDFLTKDMGVFTRTFDVDFKTKLLLLEHEYHKEGQIKILNSNILILDRKGDIKEGIIGPNEPFDFNGIRIYQSYSYGYTLSFVLKRKDGEEVITHFNLDMIGKKGEPLVGKSDFPTTNYLFQIKFYPDVTGQSFYVTKPIVYLTISELISNNIVFKGLLLPKHSIKIKDDILTFAGITEWSGLIFAKTPGIIISYIGFIAGTAGALVMFGFPYKEVRISVEKREGESALFVYAITKRYQAIFKEEVKEILDEIKQVCQS
jgi:hypothetical protein